MTNKNRKPTIIGNWKMNLLADEALSLVKSLKDLYENNDKIDIIVSPTYTYLYPIGLELKNSSIGLCAQNVYYEEKGAYTGEISPSMIKDVGCEFVIIGHSERRHIMGENNADINKKIIASLKQDLTIVLCIGELLKEREEGKTSDIIKEQISIALEGLSPEKMKNIIIAYEPVWAIGTGKNAVPEQINEVHMLIRSLVRDIFGKETAENLRILYGGSVSPDSIDSLVSSNIDVDGFLVGGASLKPDKINSIIERILRN